MKCIEYQCLEYMEVYRVVTLGILGTDIVGHEGIRRGDAGMQQTCIGPVWALSVGIYSGVGGMWGVER